MAVIVDAIDHIVINVRDVDVAAAWYQRVLGMTREDWQPGPGKSGRTTVKFGRQKINLRPISATQQEWFTGKQVAPGSDDLCFLTRSSPQAVADDRVCLLPRSRRQSDRDFVLQIAASERDGDQRVEAGAVAHHDAFGEPEGARGIGRDLVAVAAGGEQ